MGEEVPEIFKYERPPLPKDCIHAISPSQIAKFFEYPKVWYEENILGKGGFTGNTATVTGTIAHHIYKSVTLEEEVTRDKINEQLLKYMELFPNPDVDVTQVMIDYPLVSTEVVNTYVIPHDNKGAKIKVEQPVVAPVMDGIYVAGTYDRLEGTCVVDYKNVGSKPNENALPFSYRIQLLAYAYALRKQGHTVDRIRCVYGVKPTKTIPARCFVVTEQIDYVAEKLVEDTLQLIGETVLKAKENPDLVYLLFKSMDLKQ